MLVYQTDHLGRFVGVVTADESPLEPGVFLFPAGCIGLAPPPFNPESHIAVWDGEAWDIAAIPAPEPVPEPEFPDPPTPTKIAKADIWRRLTDEEAETVDAALQAAPLRLRRIFEAAQYLDTADADYPALRGGIVAALGETRADEVLAPTY